ncbi:ExeM/NucH family extracellular endonuclease [Xanthomonas fragariae]|uniref:ExeM/NucH family extracellular endonuclease n=1 Tax=Xanthomonas fragariae TaxID=48664 RepID=UPI000D557E89|nr:ExeM/NucH family extracellular endonuclease [Xanthomonas fragariae]MDM7554419.1 ExeM/NucH family extracellular endonuclease [Xanthomonas fragariae]MDM7557550.1 ExeM/NucH family extracellular endonuclease [Xanthomonas fragariae]MDM7575245.1 ExeM/NucH family extracellular endonuclease [Xanthomonas fragariae]MDM7578351.1 ExeM/NucH family extracellular endonuclease [Xanthomonas fragariae]MDM7588548.1 ExeM/NucH family extracellular endonuclease [Xanthomonas fragariae]
MSRCSLVVLCVIGLLAPLLGSADDGAPQRLTIADVQGEDTRSPYDDRVVEVEGIVTADTRVGLAGLFVQQPGFEPRRSHGLFVTGASNAEVAVGDRVRIVGAVREVSAGGEASLTTVDASSIERLASGQPVPVRMLSGPPANWEALEGEHVRIAALTLNGSDRLDTYGELVAAFGGRLWQPSEVAAAGTPAFAQVDADNARRRVLLDDAHNGRSPRTAPYLPADPVLRSGSLLKSVDGIVDQRYDGQYRIQMLNSLTLPAMPTAVAPQVGGDLRIASFNLENFFNGNGHGGGFPTERGARTHEQFQAQLAKLVSTIVPLRADVVALMELENDGNGADAAVAQLVTALNAFGEEKDWRFVDTGSGPGNDAIRVGIVYRSSQVTPVGPPATVTGGPFDSHSRVPLAQAFRSSCGVTFVVVANHFKSKECGNASGADTDQQDGQACWNAARTESAKRLHQWLQTDPTGARTKLAVLLGDFNAYAMETPMRSLRASGWQDAFAVAGVKQPYSYVYYGISGRLDHALLSPAMAKQLRGAVEWHINADVMGDAGYAKRNLPGVWRSSDHDPLLLGFSL